jgi:alpha-tubulin suppressor-like RCC1 family protein
MKAFRKNNKGLTKGIENLKAYLPIDSKVKLDHYELSIDDKFLVVKKIPKGVEPEVIVKEIGGDSKFANQVLKLSFYSLNLGPEPEAVIDIKPLSNISTITFLEYGHENSKAEQNEILKVEWKNAESYFDEEGVQTIKLRIMDKHFRWSEWATKDIFVSENKGVKSINGFGGHLLIVHKNGEVDAYGENSFGQLGNCTQQNNSKIERLIQVKKVEAVALGDYHTVFLMADKRVFATGKNDFGQLGIGDRVNSKIPKLTWGIENVISISAGNSFSAAVTIEGKVYTWGQNESTCLGYGESHFVDRPMRVEGLEKVREIVLGHDFALALHYDRNVSAWGDNNYGALGLGFKSKYSEPSLSLLKDIKSIIAGKNYGYGITNQKKVLAFGSNKNYQLGFEGEKEVLFPREVAGLKDIEKLVTYNGFSLALDERGNVYAWGQFSLAEQDFSVTPYISEELKFVKDIAVAFKFGFALMEDGTVYEFGSKFSNLRKLEYGIRQVDYED